MEPGDRTDLVETLTRRRAILEAIDDEPVHKPVLARELDVARSTVDRAVRQLEAKGLAERGQEGVALTTAGALALDVYGEFATRLDAVWDARDVLADLPGPDLADPAFFDGADVVRATVSAPDRPVRAFVDLVAQATHARGFSPTAYGAYVDAFERGVVEDGLTAELAFSDEALTELTTTHRDAIVRAANTGRVTVHRVDDLPSAGLVVMERADAPTVAAMGVHDGAGLDAVVTNDDPSAVAWARDLVDDRYAAGDRIPL